MATVFKQYILSEQRLLCWKCRNDLIFSLCTHIDLRDVVACWLLHSHKASFRPCLWMTLTHVYYRACARLSIISVLSYVTMIQFQFPMRFALADCVLAHLLVSSLADFHVSANHSLLRLELYHPPPNSRRLFLIMFSMVAFLDTANSNIVC